MSKILIFTDIHIHRHKKSDERLNHCLDVLKWIFDLAVKKNIKNVVFLGDLFHQRQNMEIITYNKAFYIFEEYLGEKPPFHLYLLLGNHDLWYDNKYNISSVVPLRSLNGVTVINKPCNLNIENYEIGFLPYTHDPKKDLKRLEKNAKCDVLCGHIAIDGALWNVKARTVSNVSIEHDGDMVKVGTDIFSKWNNVFLGHYHAEQKLSENVEYVGSPLQLDFGEAFQHKHVLIFDLETKEKEYIRNDFSPQHFIIPEKDIDKYDLNKNFIRIEVEDISNSSIADLKNNINKNNKVGSLEIKQSSIKKDNEADEKIIEEAKSILFQKGEMINKYVEQQKKLDALNDLDEKKLLEIGNSVISGTQS